MVNTAGRIVLIVEPHSRGHRLHYVRFLVEECRSRFDKAVILTTKEAIDSAEWQVHLEHHAPSVLLQPSHAFELHDITHAAAGLGADVTILPDADGYVSEVLLHGWSGPGMLTMLIMRGEVQPGPPFSWLRPVKTLVKRTLIWGADRRRNVRAYVLRSPLIPRRGPLHWLPEPVELSCTSEQVEALSRQLDRDEGRYWIGVFGDITARKNLELIAEAIVAMPNIGLLTAGPVDPEVSAAISPLLEKFVSNGGRVHQIGGPLGDSEFDSAISAVDCVIAAHTNEGPSSVVLKAVASGRRLVLAGAQSLRRDAAQVKDQAVWTPLDVRALRHAIEQARCAPQPTASVKPGCDEFVKALTCR